MTLNPLRRALRALLPVSLDQRARAILFKLRQRTFRPRTESFRKYGDDWKFYIGDPVGENWFVGGWDWPEIDFLHRCIVQEGDVILECGGHHGELSSFFARWVGDSGRVIVFDPVPENCSIIRKNLALNGATNAEVHQAAVGAQDGHLDMTLESNARIAEHTTATRRVAVTHVDAWAGVKPTVLKIDVEGYEAEVLKGSAAVLETRPKLAIELHPNMLPRFGASCSDVLDLLSPYQYHLYYRLKGEPHVRPYEGQALDVEAHLFALPTPIG